MGQVPDLDEFFDAVGKTKVAKPCPCGTDAHEKTEIGKATAVADRVALLDSRDRFEQSFARIFGTR